ncbi:MAG: hypothetical protein JWL64_1363 [Frankiales bacterium]|nr:hypothetical protein [Frankiales bacterium]
MTVLTRLDRAAARMLARLLPRRGSGRLAGAGLGLLFAGVALMIGSLHAGELFWLPVGIMVSAAALLAAAVTPRRDRARRTRPDQT